MVEIQRAPEARGLTDREFYEAHGPDLTVWLEMGMSYEEALREERLISGGEPPFFPDERGSWP